MEQRVLAAPLWSLLPHNFSRTILWCGGSCKSTVLGKGYIVQWFSIIRQHAQMTGVSSNLRKLSDIPFCHYLFPLPSADKCLVWGLPAFLLSCFYFFWHLPWAFFICHTLPVLRFSCLLPPTTWSLMQRPFPIPWSRPSLPCPAPCFSLGSTASC